MQRTGPGKTALRFEPLFLTAACGLAKKREGQIDHTPRLNAIDGVALTELFNGQFAGVMMLGTMQQILEHTLPQCAIGDCHRLDAEHRKNRRQNGKTARQHRHAIRLETFETQVAGIAGA